MSTPQKATGWKLPLIFCSVIFAAGGILHMLLPSGGNLPPLPQDLVEKARATNIDLDNDDGKPWKDAIVEAASGFYPRDLKDSKLADVIQKALAQKRPDAACAAIVQIGASAKRDAILSDILAYSLRDCGDLTWGVFAVASTSDSKLAARHANALASRWQECGKK